MNNEQKSQEQQGQEAAAGQAEKHRQLSRQLSEELSQQEGQQQNRQGAVQDVDGLANKKPEELTPEELRLMADTMHGEGPGD